MFTNVQREMICDALANWESNGFPHYKHPGENYYGSDIKEQFQRLCERFQELDGDHWTEGGYAQSSAK